MRSNRSAVTDRRPCVAVVSSVHRWNDTRIFVREAASLAANGFNIVFAAIGDQPAPFEQYGVRVVPLPRRRRAFRWLTWISILRLVIAEGASVVHVHDPELIPLVLLLRLSGRRAICDIHENVSEQVLNKEWIPRPFRAPMSKLLKATQRWLPRVVDAVILAEDSYQRDFPAAPNVSVIHNFPVLPLRCKQRYDSSVLRLVYVGDVRRVRGIAEYVEIADRLASEGVPVELRVVGSFASRHEEDQIKARIRELGLEDRVKLLGRRPPEEIPALLEDCDIGLSLLHPIGNYRDSYPTKMFEYMATGLPVVASNFPLWQRVLVPNECGRVVDPLNVDEAAGAVLDYWRSPQLRERHGRNGRSAVVRQYHWGHEVPHLVGVYAALFPATVAAS